MNSRYGKVFRILRQQKNLPLSYFEKIGIGKSHVGKFERGEVMMSLERVDNMLQLMNISLGEFEIIVNYYVPDFQNSFLLEIMGAEFHQDKKKLTKLYTEAKDTENIWLIIISKARVEGLVTKEVSQVKEYLSNIKVWGYFEIILAFSTVDFFEEEEIVQLIEELKIKNRTNYGDFKYRRSLYHLIFRSIVLLAAKENEKEARKALGLMKYFGAGSVDFYISVLNLLIEGLLEYLYKSKKEGKEAIADALFMIEKLGNAEFRMYHEKRILKLLGLKQF